MDTTAADQRQPVIVITGAAGFTGMHACSFFAESGMRVAAIVRNGPTAGDSLPDCVERHVCDLLNKEQLRDVISTLSPDYVLHLGGKNSVPESWMDPILYMESNVLATLYLLDALRPYPHCRIVIAGSRLTSALTAPYQTAHPYSLSKSLQEAASLSWNQLFGQIIMMAEPSNLIGPGPSTGFCALLARHIARTECNEVSGAFHISSRQTVRDFLDVRDAVRAYAVLLERGESGRNYPICSGDTHTLGEVAEQMLSYASSAVAVEWGEDIEPVPSGIYSSEELIAIGWKPLIPLNQSLEECIRHFQGKEEGKV